MTLKLYLQSNYIGSELTPTEQQFIQWITVALQNTTKTPSIIEQECTICLVDEKQSAHYNQTYRHKKGPTNVLSFPAANIVGSTSYYLGDLIICVPLVKREAEQQHKEIIAHWAHLTIHGILHLLGYDHEKEEEAVVMEALEIAILQQLSFANPY